MHGAFFKTTYFKVEGFRYHLHSVPGLQSIERIKCFLWSSHFIDPADSFESQQNLTGHIM